MNSPAQRQLDLIRSSDEVENNLVDDKRRSRVKFVATNQEQKEQQLQLMAQKLPDELLPINGQPELSKSSLPSVIRPINNNAGIPEIMDSLNPPAANLGNMDADSFGSNWMGNYKYNPYGEPVYGHTNRPNYIPKQRVFHFDLKGAPPLMSMLKTLIPWLSNHGATAILFEYEDVFPHHGMLSKVASINHYTEDDIQELIQLCEKHNLEVIPLVQTFGHLEFVLKHEKFSKLREIPEVPLALCPSRNESLNLVHELIDQVMALHGSSRYLHIGCDEVYHMGECDLCRQTPKENIFLKHVATVATYVKKKYGVKVLIWDDMLRHVSDTAMRDFRLGELVEPMVWVYAEDIYRFVQPAVWSKFSRVFSSIWAASAFKGAFGEQMVVPNVRRHLDNNMNWLDVMAAEGPKFSEGFRGLVLTGWQRFDHFAVLCELLPAAMPSIAVNLISVSHGFSNSSLQKELYTALNCANSPQFQGWINLDSDPFLWDKISWCFFPGKQVFSLTYRLDTIRKDVDSYIEKVTRSRGWITDYNRRHNFSSPMRIDEDLEELPVRMHSVRALIKSTQEAFLDWFDEWTTGEWIEQQIWPMLNKLETIQKEAESMKEIRSWPARPLPLLPQLSRFGISKFNAIKSESSRGDSGSPNDE